MKDKQQFGERQPTLVRSEQIGRVTLKDVTLHSPEVGPASFLLLYQEPVGGVLGIGGTHTFTREEPDYLQSHTRTDAREADDTDLTSDHMTFTRNAMMTKTGTREQDDTPPVLAHHALHMETVTVTKVGREQDDNDIGMTRYSAFAE